MNPASSGPETLTAQIDADRPLLGPLYHDFAWLGLPTAQFDEMHRLNQRAKAPVICAYVLLALAKLRSLGLSDISFAELFCADAFYAMFAARFGATRAVGLDNDRDGHLASAEAVRSTLGLASVSFERVDVERTPPHDGYSIVANVGGLYHVADPLAVLRWSYDLAERYLIVQGVVSLATSDPEYFEAPAPGWTWGNRQSRESFDRMIRSQGWDVVDRTFAVLPGNDRPEDQGSLFYLIAKPGRDEPVATR
jgi:hypothetical protein